VELETVPRLRIFPAVDLVSINLESAFGQLPKVGA
jgi:hypothetical protein